MRKSRKEIVEREIKKSFIKAHQLLESSDYEADYKKWESLKKKLEEMPIKVQEYLIRLKYEIHKPYNPDLLHQEVGKGIPSLLADGLSKVVDLMKFEEEGYINLKIKYDEPKDLIFYLIDHFLNAANKRLSPPAKKRFRTEKLKAIEVCEMRRERISFPQIAKKLKIKESTAKKRFLKAYEILYGKKYDAADYEKKEIKIQNSCDKCADRPTCKVLCPEVLSYVDQDSKPYQRERTGIF